MTEPRPYAELVRNFLVDAASARTGWRGFFPLMTNLYLTKQCNLRCRYCYPPGDERSLPAEEMLALLDKIRPGSPALNVTGGEPLLYPAVGDVLARARELRFRPILLSTNGLLLERIADRLDLVDHVVISLDSLERDVNERMTGVAGSTERIVRAIDLASELSRRHRFALSVHAVLAPDTLDGIEDLLAFCEARGASLTLSPEHEDDAPLPVLRHHPRYESLLDRLITLKRAGRGLVCSEAYLRAIRDFRPHRCYPWISPRVEPDGRVYVPCRPMKRGHVYLQDYTNLVELMRREALQPIDPRCAQRCFLACYLEPERYLRQPLALVGNSALRRVLLGRGAVPGTIR